MICDASSSMQFVSTSNDDDAAQSKRALQFCNGDTDRAAEFALQQRQAAEV